MKCVILHFEKMAVMYITRGMVSASSVVMNSFILLERLLKEFKVKVGTRWLLSFSNSHADRLSRKWCPGYIQVTRRILCSLHDSCAKGNSGAVFPYRQLLLAPETQWKVAMAAMEEV